LLGRFAGGCGAGVSTALAIFDQCISGFYAALLVPGNYLRTLVEQRATGFIPGIDQQLLLTEWLRTAHWNISAHLISGSEIFLQLANRQWSFARNQMA
jgi:hypothetical protein